MSKFTTKDKIIFELHEAVKKLGAKSCLLSITGSYGDTLEDEEILYSLKEWNEGQNE